MHAKLSLYFAHGTRLAWVINPLEHNTLFYRISAADGLLRLTGAFGGEDVLPGFRLPLAELFAELSFEQDGRRMPAWAKNRSSSGSEIVRRPVVRNRARSRV